MTNNDGLESDVARMRAEIDVLKQAFAQLEKLSDIQVRTADREEQLTSIVGTMVDQFALSSSHSDRYAALGTAVAFTVHDMLRKSLFLRLWPFSKWRRQRMALLMSRIEAVEALYDKSSE